MRTVLLFDEPGVKVSVIGDDATIVLVGENRAAYGSFITMTGTGASSRLRVKGLRYRYKDKPFVLGVVKDMVGPTGNEGAWGANDYIDVEVDWTPTFEDVQWVQSFKNGYPDDVPFYDKTGFEEGGAFQLQPSTGYWRLNTSGNKEATYGNLAIDDIVSLQHQKYACHFLRVENGGDVFLEDIEINHNAGPAIRVNGGRMCYNHNIRITPDAVHSPNVELKVPHSVNGGGLIVSARFVDVHDCALWATGDDALNVWSSIHRVTEKNGQKQLTFSMRPPHIQPCKGDLVQIYDSNRVAQLETRIKNFQVTGNSVLITVWDPLPAMPTPTEWEIGLVVESAVVGNNHLGRNRARGMGDGAQRYRPRQPLLLFDRAEHHDRLAKTAALRHAGAVALRQRPGGRQLPRRSCFQRGALHRGGQAGRGARDRDRRDRGDSQERGHQRQHDLLYQQQRHDPQGHRRARCFGQCLPAHRSAAENGRRLLRRARDRAEKLRQRQHCRQRRARREDLSGRVPGRDRRHLRPEPQHRAHAG
jgi:hypothetical protein